MKPTSLLKVPEADRDLEQRLYDLETRLGDRLYETEKGLAAIQKRPVPPKPAQPVRQLSRELKGVGIDFERQRVTHRALDELYFHVEMMPNEGYFSGGPPVLDATTLAWTFEDWPPGAVTRRRKQKLAKALWPRTQLRFNLWYTSPVANTANFTLSFNVRQLDAGMGLGASSLPLNQGITPPGPAVANNVLFYTYTITGSLAPALRLCQFSLSRMGPDANPNDFRFIFAEWFFQEVA